MSTDSAAERLAQLQRIASTLSDLLTPYEVAEVILREVAPELGGVGRALWLVDEEHRHLELVRPDDHLRARPFATMSLDEDLPGPAVVRSGRPVFMENKDERDQAFPALANIAPQVAIAVLPLATGDRVVGILAFSYDDDHEFTTDERSFFVAVADLASHALERGRLHARQVEVARALQRTLLPPDLPDVRHVDLAAVYHPAWAGIEVGGDFYDVFPLPGSDRWVVTIGDVCGTGADAAAITAQVRHTVRTAARLGASIAEIAMVVNEALIGSIDDDRFCTMVVATMAPRPDGIDVELVSAGHPHPIVVRAGGGVEPLITDGMLLGVFPGISYVPVALRLEDGDSLVLYTDGVTEARALQDQVGVPLDLFESPRLLEALAPAAGSSAEEVVAALERALLAYTSGQLADDVAILVIRSEGSRVGAPAG